jgi:large subunit ribosomal protein L21
MSYAVIKTGGKQYRVTPGDVLEVEKIDAAAGTEVVITDVPLAVDGSTVKTSGVKVVAEVLAATKAPKVIAYKYRRRKGYHRTVGHRQKLTQIKVKSIEG